MELPEPIGRLLDTFEVAHAAHDPGLHPCQGAKFHSPRPLRVQEVLIRNKTVYLCANCKSNLEVFIFLWNKNNGLDWEAQRAFGNLIRALGQHIVEGK